MYLYPLKNLRRRKGRTALTIAGVTLAIMLTVTMFALSEGMRSSVRHLVEEGGVELFVYGEGGDNLFYQPDFNDGRALAETINATPEVRAAFPMLAEPLLCAKNETQPKVVGLVAYGIVPDLMGKFGGIEFIEGIDMPHGDDPFYANGSYNGTFTHEMIVNHLLAKNLGVAVGETIYMSRAAPMGNNTSAWLETAYRFEVCGIMKASWEDPVSSCYIHLGELQFMVAKTNDTIDRILVDLYDPGDTDLIEHQVENTYNLSAYTAEEFIQNIETFTDIFQGLSRMIAYVTIIVAILFTSTIAMLATRERTNEIGALRAMGFSKLSIFKLILAEAIIICMIGYVIGIVLGAGTANLLDVVLKQANIENVPTGFHFTKLTLPVILKVTGIAAIVGIISGLLPAYVATKVSIATILRCE